MADTSMDKPHSFKTYTVYELLYTGMRFSDDFDEADAISMFMELHPEADPVAVRAELTKEISHRG